MSCTSSSVVVSGFFRLDRDQGIIRIWDVDTGCVVAECREWNVTRMCISFVTASPNVLRLASSDISMYPSKEPKLIRIRRCDKIVTDSSCSNALQIEHELRNPYLPVVLTFIPDGSHLVILSREGINIWNCESGNSAAFVESLDEKMNPTFGHCFCHEGANILIQIYDILGTQDSTLIVRNALTGVVMNECDVGRQDRWLWHWTNHDASLLLIQRYHNMGPRCGGWNMKVVDTRTQSTINCFETAPSRCFGFLDNETVVLTQTSEQHCSPKVIHKLNVLSGVDSPLQLQYDGDIVGVVSSPVSPMLLLIENASNQMIGIDLNTNAMVVTFPMIHVALKSFCVAHVQHSVVLL